MQPLTVRELEPAFLPPIELELETVPLPAWAWTDVPPADVLDATEPDELDEDEATAPLSAAVTLPSALRLTVTVHAAPADVVPRISSISACAVVDRKSRPIAAASFAGMATSAE